MNQASLKKILSDHCLWVNDEGGERANLSCANLSGANLRGANLSCANLSGANLSDANLSNANLPCANLSNANLSRKSIGRTTMGIKSTGRKSIVRKSIGRKSIGRKSIERKSIERKPTVGANLSGANLRGANGNMIHIKSMQLGTYSIAYTSDYLQIGCERHPIKAWWGFDAKTIEEMDCNATEFWCKFKSHIKQTIELSPAEATGYKESEK